MNEYKIKNVVQSISHINSDNFFDEICISLSAAINADFVFIAKIDGTNSIANSIAVASKGRKAKNFIYSLESTPCADVTSTGICSHNGNIQQLYPSDRLLIDMNIRSYVGISLKNNLGDVDSILVALFEESIESVHEVETLFLLFSGLIEKELHKVSYSKAIELSNKIIENTHEAIIVCDKNKLISYVNSSFTNMTGYTLKDLIGRTPKILSSGKQDNFFYQAMWADLNENGHWQGEIWNKRKDGSEYLGWLSITAISNENGDITNYTAFFSDITEQHLIKEKVKFQNSYDLLTKAANKSHLFTFIERSILQADYSNQAVTHAALLIIDIDLFKKFNTLYSHSIGDKVLIHVADQLQDFVRSTDIVARTSDDNFALFINHFKSKDAVIHIIENIIQTFLPPFKIDNNSLKITLSIGVAFLGKDALYAQELFEKAEQAKFFAKDNRRHSYGFYNKHLSLEAKQEEELKLALENAVVKNEFSVVYQPIICLKNNPTNKFEALVRWKKNGELISPVHFIETAEKYGLIAKIGDIVFNSVCLELKKLQELGITGVVINVNRSIYEFPADATDMSWLKTIYKHGINPKNICFEITESVMAPEHDSYIQFLSQLQTAGCTIALDDFGTGYSSLSYLRKYPIDVLKIDRSFILDMAKEKGDKVLVSAIISMAKAMNMQVVAEGVETKQEVDILLELGCDYIQGFYYSKPMPAQSMLQYILNLKIP